MTGTRKKPKPSPVSPPEVVGLPAVIDAPQQTEHPHQNFDRAARAAVARLSGGVICCAGLASIPCRSKTDVEGRKLSFVTALSKGRFGEGVTSRQPEPQTSPSARN
jgi:hypothetical protein